MAKAKFKSGDIIQITLPNQLGFSYAKCIDLLEINPHAHYPVLMRVYNYRSFVLNETVQKFLSKELILCPLLIAGLLPAISKGSWKIIGNLPVEDSEKNYPTLQKG
jgi:hypothetical protein